MKKYNEYIYIKTKYTKRKPLESGYYGIKYIKDEYINYKIIEIKSNYSNTFWNDENEIENYDIDPTRYELCFRMVMFIGDEEEYPLEYLETIYKNIEYTDNSIKLLTY